MLVATDGQVMACSRRTLQQLKHFSPEPQVVSMMHLLRWHFRLAREDSVKLRATALATLQDRGLTARTGPARNALGRDRVSAMVATAGAGNWKSGWQAISGGF